MSKQCTFFEEFGRGWREIWALVSPLLFWERKHFEYIWGKWPFVFPFLGGWSSCNCPFQKRGWGTPKVERGGGIRLASRIRFLLIASGKRGGDFGWFFGGAGCWPLLGGKRATKWRDLRCSKRVVELSCSSGQLRMSPKDFWILEEGVLVLARKKNSSSISNSNSGIRAFLAKVFFCSNLGRKRRWLAKCPTIVEMFFVTPPLEFQPSPPYQTYRLLKKKLFYCWLYLLKRKGGAIMLWCTVLKCSSTLAFL